jgi:hypothetical protein
MPHAHAWRCTAICGGSQKSIQRRWDEMGAGQGMSLRGAGAVQLTGAGAGGRVAPRRQQDINRPASQGGSSIAADRASARALPKPGGDS